MSAATGSQAALRQILEVTRKLAAPFDLDTMLTEVVNASREILNAERGTVFLYDDTNDELVVRVGTDLNYIRIPANKGIVGESAQTRRLINVPDCYADERFNRAIDKQTGYKSRCMLTIPLIGYEESLIGVLQILNKYNGVFDEEDEYVGQALAAQAAVVIHRAKLTEAIIASERLDREISVARDVQIGTLPKGMPVIAGYDFGGAFVPTDQTGGDLYDFVPMGNDRLFLLMGDATGHGIGPALSATQVRAMLRVALRLGSGLDEAFVHINDQLCDDLPDDRFVTGFFGVLDGQKNTVSFHSGGQGPIMHFHAASGEFDWHPATTFPLGYMPQTNIAAPLTAIMQPGDVFGLISDGIYEYENETGEQFGQQRVAEIVASNRNGTAQQLVNNMLQAVRHHGGKAIQADDITIVVAKRLNE
jgi:sigma-B regulation protein RsbU (phosphoserine phosphatase)